MIDEDRKTPHNRCIVQPRNADQCWLVRNTRQLPDYSTHWVINAWDTRNVSNFYASMQWYIYIGPSLLIFFSFSSSIHIHILWSIATHELLIKLINIVLHTNDIKQTNNKFNNQQTFCLLHSTPKNHVRWHIRSTDPPVDVPHEKRLLTMYKGNTCPPALGPNSLIISFSLTACMDFQW